MICRPYIDSDATEEPHWFEGTLPDQQSSPEEPGCLRTRLLHPKKALSLSYRSPLPHPAFVTATAS